MDVIDWTLILIFGAGVAFVGLWVVENEHTRRSALRTIENVWTKYYEGRKELAIELIRRGVIDEDELNKKLNKIYPPPPREVEAQ